jgi:hypothetical protein
MPFRLKVKTSDIVADAPLNMLGQDIEQVGTLYGQREVIQQEETLIKQTIVPASAGAEALIVRDAANVVNRAVIREDGTAEVREMAVGDVVFSNGARLTEIPGGIALISPDGKIVGEWRWSHVKDEVVKR